MELYDGIYKKEKKVKTSFPKYIYEIIKADIFTEIKAKKYTLKY